MHESCGYTLSLVCSFDKTENKHNFEEEETILKGFAVI